MHLHDAITEFLLDRQTQCSPRTVTWYSQTLTQMESFFATTPSIECLTPSDLMRYVVFLRERPRADFRQGHLSSYTVHNHVRSLKALFKYALRQDWIVSDACAGLKSPRLTSQPKALTTEQVQHIKDCLDQGMWPAITRDRALVSFMLDSGCRAGETIGLASGHLNLAEGWADVTGKGNKTRRVGLSPLTTAALTEYLGQRQGIVFQTDEGHPLMQSSLRQIIRRLSAKVGFHLNPHLFRHTFGTLWVESGGDVSHLQTMMGHSQVSTTHIYVEKARAKAALQEHRQHSPLLFVH